MGHMGQSYFVPAITAGESKNGVTLQLSVRSLDNFGINHLLIELQDFSIWIGFGTLPSKRG